MRRLCWLTLPLLFVPTAALAQEKGEWSLWGYYGQSWFILGSEDIRRGGGLAVQ